MCAPMRRSTSRNAVRRGLSRTFSMRTNASGRTRPATTRNAALETSPGTSRETGRRVAPPWTETAAPFTSTATPNAGSRRSVWSRVAAGSTTVVRPSAWSPASRTADFTCALGVVMAQCIALSGPPSITRGGFPSDEDVRAPMRRKGSATRSTGRRRSDASPVIVVRKGRAGHHSRQHAQRRPGVGGIERARGRLQALGPAAHDLDRAALVPGLDAERLQAPQRGRAIVRGREVLEPALPVRERPHDGEAVGERLVPREGRTGLGIDAPGRVAWGAAERQHRTISRRKCRACRVLTDLWRACSVAAP